MAGACEGLLDSGGLSSVVPTGGVGMATVLVGLPAGTFSAAEVEASDDDDTIVSELGARGWARLFPIARGLGR